VEVGKVIESTFEANEFGGQQIFHQEAARVADAYLDQEIIKRFLGHQFIIQAKRGNSEVGDSREYLQADFLFIIAQRIRAYLVDAYRIHFIRFVERVRRSDRQVLIRLGHRSEDRQQYNQPFHVGSVGSFVHQVD